MKKFAVVVSLLAVPAFLVPALAGPDKKPKKDKPLETAVHCVLAGMNAGAYGTLTSEALADYCVDVAKRVHGADYTLP